MRRQTELTRFKKKFPNLEEVDKVFDYFWYEYIQIERATFYKEAFDSYNKIMNKRLRMIDPKFKRQVESLAKHGYTLDDFERALKNAKDDDFHAETNYKYLTPEYITRPSVWDKYYIEEVTPFEKAINNIKV